MRTTLDLTEEAYVIAKTIARERKVSLGKAVSDLIVAETSGVVEDTGSLPVKNGFPQIRCQRRITSADDLSFSQVSVRGVAGQRTAGHNG